MAKKVRISVLKKQLYTDFAQRFLTEPEDAECSLFNEGDEYIFSGQSTMPEGFCPWAWVDIAKDVVSLSNGASMTPWFNRPDINVACCSDGIRPVSFLLERLDEDC